MEESLLLEIGGCLASVDFVTWLFPKQIREAFFFLDELEDGNIDNGLTIPGVMERPFIMADWLVDPRDPEANQAHDDLVAWVACQFNVTSEDINTLRKARLDAFLT